jgi:hypothetical protein
MLQRVIVGLASLIVLAAAAAGGWWFAADRGWIAGKPNSARKENFKLALDEHLRRGASYYQRPCAPVDMTRPPDGMGPADVRFDWTPAGFRAVVDPRQPQTQRAAQRYPYFAKQGYMEAKALAEGATEYTLTWKGYGASTGQPCFVMAKAERLADVLSFSKKRTENGVDVYEVVARAAHQGWEAWSQTPEFKQIYADQSLQRYLEPQPVAYELARGDRGWEVIGEQGKALSAQTRNAVRSEIVARMAGGVTAERVRTALEGYLASPQGAQQARLCLRPPEQHQVDEGNLDAYRYRGPGGAELSAPTLTFYNVLMRQPYAGQESLRGYVLMKKLEALGFATSETLPAASFRDQPAAGAVRFTLAPSFLARFSQERCYPVGTAQVDAVVSFEPITETSLAPPFVARVKIKPFDEEGAKIIAALPHFARMQEVGGVLRGTLQYHENDLRVANLQPHFPMYHPDVSAVRLPVVESPPGQKPKAAEIRPERAAQLRKADALVASMKPGVRAIVLGLVRYGRKAEAIQQYSALTGEDQATSRDVVEKFIAVTPEAQQQTPVPVYANPYASPPIYAVPSPGYPPPAMLAPGSVQQRAIGAPQRAP